MKKSSRTYDRRNKSEDGERRTEYPFKCTSNDPSTEISEETDTMTLGKRNLGMLKGIKQICSFVLTAIQLITLLEGWISYALGSIIASLFTPIALLSFLWYPLDKLCEVIWMGCDWIKHLLWNQRFAWSDSSQRWERQFPQI